MSDCSLPKLEMPKLKDMGADNGLPKLEFPKLSGDENKKPEINNDSNLNQEKS
jgi:hypothetical protein